VRQFFYGALSVVFNSMRKLKYCALVEVRWANKKIKPTGTAIGEFEFSVLAIRFFKILKYSAPYVPAAYFSVSPLYGKLALKIKTLFFCLNCKL